MEISLLFDGVIILLLILIWRRQGELAKQSAQAKRFEGVIYADKDDPKQKLEGVIYAD